MTDDQRKLKWIEFQDVERHGWVEQELPPERKDVLCKLRTGVNETGAVVVGYLKYAAGDKQSPLFICGGVPHHYSHGDKQFLRWEVTHWCDCLPEGFGRSVPGWYQNPE